MTTIITRLRELPGPLTRARTLVRPPRITALDVARAVAVLGMVGAHVGDTGEPTWGDPSSWAGLVHGRSSLLFAVLAGVSVALLTGRTRRPEPADLPAYRLSLVGRGAAIFAVGLAVELLGTGVAVILTLYGLLYVAALPFLRWRASWLAAGALVLAAAGPPLLALVRALSLDASGSGLDLALFGVYPITVWLALLLAGMALGRCDLTRLRTAALALLVGAAVSAVGYGTAAAVGPALDRLQEEAWETDGGWSSSYSDGGITVLSESAPEDYEVGVPGEEVDLEGLVCDVDSFGAYCYDPDVEVDDGSWIEDEVEEPSYLDQLRDRHVGTALLVSLGSADPHSGGTAEALGSGGLAMALIGLLLLAQRVLRWPLLPLAALGSMPLTAYAAHVVVIRILAGPFGFVSSNTTWAWLAGGLVAGCTLWALLLGRGPLERLVGRAATAAARGA